MESNKIDIKSLAEILCDESSHFALYRWPVMDDRFVYVACYCLIVRINRAHADECCFDKVSYVSDFDKYEVIGENPFDMDLMKSVYNEIKDQFECEPETEEQCPECLGTGEVTWEYMGTYENYEKTDTCPECDGTGYVEREKTGLPSPGKYVSMYGHVFYAETIYRFYRILEILGASECSVKEIEHSMIRFDISYSVSIFMVFPNLIQQEKATIEIKF